MFEGELITLLMIFKAANIFAMNHFLNPLQFFAQFSLLPRLPYFLSVNRSGSDCRHRIFRYFKIDRPLLLRAALGELGKLVQSQQILIQVITIKRLNGWQSSVMHFVRPRWLLCRREKIMREIVVQVANPVIVVASALAQTALARYVLWKGGFGGFGCVLLAVCKNVVQLLLDHLRCCPLL